ncbi:protein PHLOEM PROTEIN 2-LIKE A9 [Cornus florida]|uniref:protein PHLOEM PROTEIN 2-LIKE A9 n=1 Tax=Cornus florida TaxID=4283 RepID=UPI00289A5911|nr:protein PHLOEM PROTEIN 2-LIKE A9 [Cornus florida]
MASNNPHYEADPTAKEVIKRDPYDCKIFPRGLNIVWGNDDRYWRMTTNKNESVAELLQVCWLEVSCSIPLVLKKRYQIGFTVSLTSDAFGWSGCHVFIMAKLGKKGKYIWKKLLLTTQTDKAEFQIPEENLFMEVPSQVASEDDRTLYFGLYEVWSGKWKGGLRIHHAFIKETPPPK